MDIIKITNIGKYVRNKGKKRKLSMDTECKICKIIENEEEKIMRHKICNKN